jgi:hypothetical protein
VSDIFISYKREEQPVARKLANALESEGWTVWWDPKLRAGEHFDDVIEKALNEAKCVIVMWSNLAVNSEYIKAEATEALEQRKLVPVKIENVNLPFRFKRVHTLSLLGWDGSKDFTEFRRLVEDIATIVGPPATMRKKGHTTEAKAGRPTTGTGYSLLTASEQGSISASEVGADARDLMKWHHELMARPAMERYVWERYGGDLENLGQPEPTYGRITRAELSRFIETTMPPYHINPSKKKEIIRRLELFREVVKTMDSKGAKVVDYMPAQLNNLPAHLTKRAIEVLLSHPFAFEITRNSLDSYRMLHRESREITHEVDQIAQYLGWDRE